jgi:hypothetical protein
MERDLKVIMYKIWSKLNEKFWKTNKKSEFFKRFSGQSGSGRSRSGRKTTTVTTATYYGTADEFYIGVSCDKTSTIYLPADAADGRIITVKAEMRPPLASRKVIIETTDGSKIDGYTNASINVSHGCLTLIRNNNEWYIIG